MKQFWLCFSLFMISGLGLQATNYYVAKDGADSNSGTEAAPFLTIAKASSVLSAGDTCFIKAGVYREVLQPSANGQAGSPIVYTNYLGDAVELSATEVLTNWAPYQGDIYEASFDMNLERQNMVFVDRRPMDIARWPNNTDHDPYTLESIEVQNGNASTIQSPEITSMNWTNGYVWYLAAHSGTSWTRRITESQAGQFKFARVDSTRWPFNPHNPSIVRNSNRGRFFLFGVLEALDYEEEWYYDEATDKVYLQAPGNANPNSLNVEVGVRSRTMFLNKNYIHVDGINAFGGNVEITGSNCVLRNGTFKHCLQILDELDNSDAQVGKGAIHVRASNTIIERNVIDGTSLNGIFIQGWNNVTAPIIRYNVIKNCNTVGIHASPIRSGASNVQIISNTIHTTGRDGIYCGNFNNEIAYNDVYDCMKLNNDGGLFYTVGTSTPRNSEIHHNWFHDSEGPAYADGRAAGIYLDNDSKGFSVHHNVVWNITWSGVQMNWDIWDNDIYHNTLWDVSRAMGTWLKAEHTMERIKIYNNLSNMEEWIGNDIQNNIIQTAIPFTDYDNDDFVPRQGSNVVDAGRLIAGINDNYQGSMPDIGAYEFGLSPWIPGVNTVMGGEITTSVLEEIQAEADIKLYPNPFINGDLTIQFAQNFTDKSVSILTLNGELVYETQTNEGSLKLNRNDFKSKGFYLIKVEEEGSVKTRLFLVQ